MVKLRMIRPGHYETRDGQWYVIRMDQKHHDSLWVLGNVVSGHTQECFSLEDARTWIEEIGGTR